MIYNIKHPLNTCLGQFGKSKVDTSFVKDSLYIAPNWQSDWVRTLEVTICGHVATSWLKSSPETLNPLTPNDPYSGRTAPLISKRCILYIYLTDIGTESFKHRIYLYPPFFPLQNAVCFIILTYLVPVLFYVIYSPFFLLQNAVCFITVKYLVPVLFTFMLYTLSFFLFKMQFVS